jgi:hypothetical protein
MFHSNLPQHARQDFVARRSVFSIRKPCPFLPPSGAFSQRPTIVSPSSLIVALKRCGNGSLPDRRHTSTNRESARPARSRLPGRPGKET